MPLQELWRQFLEEKEGPSEEAAATPVKVDLVSCPTRLYFNIPRAEKYDIAMC